MFSGEDAMRLKTLTLLLLAFPVLLIPAACKTAPTTTPVVYSQYELEYRLLAQYPDVFYCDPDYYPVAREGQEQQNAVTQFPDIKANADEFRAIIHQLGLPDKADYTDAEKLAIYREHKKLKYGALVTASGDLYTFSLRTGQNQGQRIEGTVTRAGQIKVTSRESSFNTCPICLTEGTLIDTPGGPVPIEKVRAGMMVWTADGAGNRVAAEVLKTASGPVPSGFFGARVTLSDGRSVTASPGHPTSEGRALAEYRAGDVLDGVKVMETESARYAGATFDLLPAGDTSIYWANGVPLRSTLSP